MFVFLFIVILLCLRRHKASNPLSFVQADELKPQMYTYPEGDVYEGTWSKEGKKHGVGLLKFTNGGTYEGRFADGLFHGYGTLFFEETYLYQGRG